MTITSLSAIPGGPSITAISDSASISTVASGVALTTLVTDIASIYVSGLVDASPGGKFIVQGTTQIVAGTNAAVQPAVTFVAVTELAEAIVLTFPLAAAYPAGEGFTIADFSGDCSVTNVISGIPQSADTIAGRAGPQELLIAPYQPLRFYSDGSSKWLFG